MAFVHGCTICIDAKVEIFDQKDSFQSRFESNARLKEMAMERDRSRRIVTRHENLTMIA